MTKKIEIQKVAVGPGERAEVRIPVGRLPAGNQILMRAQVFRSREEGPSVLLLAGVHGDEINGVEILRRALADKLFDGLLRGTVIVIPIVNVFGFINFSREVPDGKDVNRSFPGNMNGSLAARVARILTKKILPMIDFGVDFHTGGGQHYNYPQVRYTDDDDRAGELARQFAAPFLLAKRPVGRSLRKVAHGMDKPIIVYEGGENHRFDGFAIEKGLTGLRRLLHAQGMLDQSAPPERLISLRNSAWVRASHAGMFQWSKAAGHQVRKGEVIGAIHDPYGADSRLITAPRDGFLLGHNNSPLISPGDALFHLGY